MGWKTTGVTTTQIIDSNPMTWLNASVDSFHEKKYSQGIEYIDQAIKFANGNDQILVRCYAYKILLYYGLGDTQNARGVSQKAQRNNNFYQYIYDNIEIPVAFLKHDKQYWTVDWKKIVKQHIADDDVNFLERIIDSVDSDVLVSVIDDTFVINVVRKASDGLAAKVLEKLTEGKYKLSKIIDRENANANLLITASSCGKIGTVKVLLRYAVNDINSVDKDSNTPLMNAVGYEHTDLAKYLIEHGANVNCICENNATPLSQAVYNQSYEIVDMIIRKGGNINVRNIEGYSPLALACLGSKQNYKIAKLLIANGANVNWKYPINRNRTILQEIAARRFWDSDNTAIWKLLLENNADIDAQDDDGMTALMLAFDHTWFLSAELDFPNALMSKGANLRKRAKNGKNAYDIAKEKGIEIS